LSSYWAGFCGFAVPEHPGSNAQQDRYWLVEPTEEANEFINRPLDVKYLLDELERRDV